MRWGNLGDLVRILGVTFAVLITSAAHAAETAAPRITLSLQSLDGRKITEADLPRKWLIIYFGYTYCPDICPTALLDLSRLLDLLGPLAARIQPAFITIDPARDTPELLKQYVANFDPRLLALTGSESEIHAAAQQFHFYYVRYQDPKLGAYSIDHSSYFFVIDPDRHLAADFATPDIGPEEIAARLRPLLDNFEAARQLDGK